MTRAAHRHGPPALGSLARVSLAAAFAALACSTIAELPEPEECRSDTECPEGYVCAVDQGRCLPGNEAAPRAHLGFDIRERAGPVIRFRVETDGCDCTVEEEENIRELSLRRSLVSQEFFLDATVPELQPDGTTIEVQLDATFTLSQASRHHQDPSPLSDSIEHPTYVDETTVVDTVLRWPRYHPLDQNVPPDLVLWEIKPTDDALASRFLGLVPPRTDASRPCMVDSDCCEPRGDCNPAPDFCDTSVGECTAVGPAEWTYHHTYERRCSRALSGSVVTPLDDETTTDPPLSGATVTLRYADHEGERLGTPTFGAAPDTCEDDEDCPGTDQFCHPDYGECFVALAGRVATSSVGTSATGRFEAPVFTYCEALPDNVPIPRRYEVTVQPSGPRPTVTHVVDARFTPIGTDFPLVRRLCVPDWGPGATLELAFEGQPRALAGTHGEYTCCDVGCLPASANVAADGPPPVPERCDGRTSAGVAPAVTLESHFVLEGATLELWEDEECVIETPNPSGRAGSLVRNATCAEPGKPCRVEDVALGTDTESRRYSVRFESEPGSVLASRDYVIEVGPAAPSVQMLPLSPRVLVTGVVDVDAAVCARRPSGEDCAARQAVVLAERLRLPGEEDGSVPGPYLHSVNTFHDPVAGRDGAFVLPLDPGGVYVVTALPVAGSEGGPAGYTLVDLRPETTLSPLRLVLEDGVVVTLRLEQFDQRTRVIPLDRGSYLAADEPLRLADTGEPLDLNAIGTCWTPPKEGPQGCKIRRLIPPGYDLARSQVGAVRFTARRSDAAQCSVRCPMSNPAE